MPVPVTAFFEDGSHQCLYTDRFLDECTFVFESKTPLIEVKLDANRELPLVIPLPNLTLAQLKKDIRNLKWTKEGDKALKIFNEIKSVEFNEVEFSWGKLGLCLYDGRHYPEALEAFRNDFEQNPASFSSLVWQGHLLDLMNRREEALGCYKRALEMKPTSWVRHDQYGIKIDLDWIKERLKTPFQRN
jgi:tetratricopeptide (TPR) repeat protein